MTSSQTPSRRGRGGRRGRIATAGLLLAAAAAAAGGASAQEMLAAVSAPSASQQPLASSSSAASPSPSTSSGNATSSASSSPGRVISTASAPLKRDFPVPEINSGILLVGPPDYRWFGGTYGSRCTQVRALFPPFFFYFDFFPQLRR